VYSPSSGQNGKRSAVEPDFHRARAKSGHDGAAIMVGVSAPTALALRTAEATGLTLVGIARDDGFEVFTHPERIARCQ
jgi:formate dehydrogenase accessory protein FdhD